MSGIANASGSRATPWWVVRSAPTSTRPRAGAASRGEATPPPRRPRGRLRRDTSPQARDELLARDLIAHEARFTQVLSLPPPGDQRRRSEPGQGLMHLGEILRQAIGPPQSSEERSLS